MGSPLEFTRLLDAQSQPARHVRHRAHRQVLVLQVEATMYSSSCVALKQRTYNVCNDVKYAHRLIPIVTRPGASPDGKPRVLWSKFHDTIPVDDTSSAGKRIMPTATHHVCSCL